MEEPAPGLRRDSLTPCADTCPNPHRVLDLRLPLRALDINPDKKGQHRCLDSLSILLTPAPLGSV